MPYQLVTRQLMHIQASDECTIYKYSQENLCLSDGLMLNCTIEDVHKYLSATPNTAAGPDGMSGHLLKSIRTSIALPMWMIFQQFLF